MEYVIMNAKSILTRRSNPVRASLGLSLVLLFTLAASLMQQGHASSNGAGSTRLSSQQFGPAAADTCASATIISPASLPFAEDATLVSANNDIDPGGGACGQGAGSDVVYSFTPSATDTYTIGATPTKAADLSLYIITNCANPAGSCVAGANVAGFDHGEFLKTTLNAGTTYFIVVDTPVADPGAAGFHFSLRRGTPANETCATATVIDPSRLPFNASATTFGATNDVDPGETCFTQIMSSRGPDVVFQFTPADTQLYFITVTPKGDYDATLYVTTNCSNFATCLSADFGGAGDPETVAHSLTAGTTYFIAVDGFELDSGDFTFSVVPSMPHSPAAPSQLTATPVSPTQVNLAWEDNSGDEQGFRIERSLDGFAFAEIATVGPNVTTFNDTTAFADTFFFYRVFAFNGFGNSDPSNVAVAKTPANPVPVNPVIMVAPTSIDFGSVRATQSDTKTVTVKNVGGADLIVSAISNPAGAFSIVNKPTLPLTIQPTQSVDLSVRFAPLAPGPASSSFSIQSNDPATPLVTVNLAGNGTTAPVPNLDVNPAFVDFGTSTAPKTVEISNTGEADLFIATIIAPAAPFSLSGSATGTIKSGEKRTLTAMFSPPTVGVFTSGFSLLTNDPDSTLVFIPLRGVSTAVPPIVSGLQFKKNGLRFQASGSNVVSGAVLIVDGAQTFILEVNGDLWVVTKKAKSTPGNFRIRDIFISPSTHTVVVRNPNGGTSAPVSISV
jgi:hypothetical protein